MQVGLAPPVLLERGNGLHEGRAICKNYPPTRSGWNFWRGKRGDVVNLSPPPQSMSHGSPMEKTDILVRFITSRMWTRMKYAGIRWVSGVYPRSVDLFEIADLAPTSGPRIVQHQVLHPNGTLYGIATCVVVAGHSRATLDYAPFPEANSSPDMLLGATELHFERGPDRIAITNVGWRGPNDDEFKDEAFEVYGAQSKIPGKGQIDGLQDALREAASHLSDSELAGRLPAEESAPAKILVTTTAYIRNPFVVEAALRRAGGLCHDCGQPGPFISAKTGRPYLEVHHQIQLAHGGADSLQNTVALCPNCHRRRHHE